MAAIGLDDFGAALAALSALSAASFGLLDASKGVYGGVARIGLGHIHQALTPFRTALDTSMGAGEWWVLVKANWMNGMTKDSQKAVVRSLIKLGLTPRTAEALAIATHVEPADLSRIAVKLAKGAELTEAELSVLGRLNAVLDAKLDSGFEQADQQYRNVNRLLAGVVAIGLAMGAWLMWPASAENPQPSGLVAFAIGLLAVPMAPVAKDLTSGLTTAMKALKARL